MGMFDYVRSSYNLGEEFTDRELQTKEIEKYIGGTMSHYWIDPAGQLFVTDYRDTHDLVENPQPALDEPKWWNPPFKYVPNGNHGTVSPVYLTDYVTVYPSNWKGEIEDWPRMRLHLIDGKLQDFKEIRRSK